MNFLRLLKNPKAFIRSKANEIAEQKIRQQNYIPITETQENDIFIASYPKSGVTWMINMITGILLESKSKRLNLKIVNEIIPDVHAKQYYKRFFPVMFFKTHDLPKPTYKKVIHVVRDGRDAMVSYYKMNINMNINFPFSLKDMIVEGKGIFPSKWYIHTKLWNQNPYNTEIITIRYEDLKTNPVKELKKVCDFADISVSDEFLISIINENTIDKLREKVKSYGLDYENNFRNEPATSFFRKGEVGNFRIEMDEELISYFNKEARKELMTYNYL